MGAKFDPYEGIAASKENVDTQQLAKLLGISRRNVSAGLLHSLHTAPHLRFCERCLTVAYHCIVHQVTWITHCPMHPSYALQSSCPRCGAQVPYHFNARVVVAD